MFRRGGYTKEMKRTDRVLCLLIAAVMAAMIFPGVLLGGEGTAKAGAVSLQVTLRGETATGETIPLEGSFRIWQDGRECGTIRSGEDILNLGSGEHLRIEPIPETMSPGWDLQEAYQTLETLAAGDHTIEIILKPYRGPETDSRKASVQTDDANNGGSEDGAGFAADGETGRLAEDGTDSTSDNSTDLLNQDASGEEEPVARADHTPTMGPTPEPTPGPTPVAELAEVHDENGGSVWVNVYLDKNGNGEQGNYEDGIRGVTVVLESEDGTPLARQETDADGRIAFEKIPEGSYRLRCWAPEKRCYSKKGKADSLTANCMEPSGEEEGVSESFRVRSGALVERGIGLMPAVRISGTCWMEDVAEGIYRDGESGIAGVKITLDGVKNGLHYETVSRADGTYSFDRVKPGGYTLTAWTPEGMMFTRYSVKGGNRRSIITREGATKGTRNLDASDGDDMSEQNIGFVWAGGIRGMCFVDANYNGLYDEGEAPVKGVKIAIGKENAEKETAAVKSGEDGTFTIPSLRGGKYRVRVVLPDDGSEFSRVVSVPEGNHFAARAGRRENFWNDFQLADMETREVNVGVIYPATVSGTVYMDDDFSGTRSGKEKIVGGFNVTLLDEKGRSVGSDKSNVKGVYEITGVVPGEYTLHATALNGYAFTKTGEGSVLGNLGGGEGESSPFRVESGDRLKGLDIGMILPGTVEGVVFADRNDDGIMQADEGGLSGAVVKLMSEEGENFRVVIGADGRFVFDAVMPGRYYLAYELPAGAVFASVPNTISGGNTITSDGTAAEKTEDSTGMTSAGSSGLTGRGDWFDFPTGGHVQAPLCGALTLGSIRAAAFRDPNGNGVMDAGETAVSGMKMIWTPERAGLEELSATSGTDGLMEITGIRPGEWTVTLCCPDGTVMTRAAWVQGTLPLKSGETNQTIRVNAAMGQEWNSGTIGCAVPAGLAGVAWLDENNNGLMDEGEARPAGYRLTVVDERDSSVFAELVTDEQGVFQSSGMVPGSYTLMMVTANNLAAAKDGDSTFHAEDLTDGSHALVQRGVVLTEGDARSDLRLGFVRYSRLDGTVWMDRGGEVESLAGALVTLTDGNGNPLASMTTGADGRFGFMRLMPGTYRVEAELPAGCVVVEPGDARLAEGLVSIAKETNSRHGVSGDIAVVMGKDLAEMNVGAVLPGAVGDLCWLDLDGDGLQGMGEGGISGVKIELMRDGTVIAETVTDQYGFYRFEDVYPATYTLAVTPPSEVRPTRQGVRPALINSKLREEDSALCETVAFAVESAQANYDVDIGFVCRAPGVYPPGYGEGKKQNWGTK